MTYYESEQLEADIKAARIEQRFKDYVSDDHGLIEALVEGLPTNKSSVSDWQELTEAVVDAFEMRDFPYSSREVGRELAHKELGRVIAKHMIAHMEALLDD